MAKIRFKSIFDRMLFLQCVTVLSLLLLLGLGIGYVSRMQSLSMEKDILVEKGQEAVRILEAGGSMESLRPRVEERKLLIQVLSPEGTESAYTDEKWAPLVELPGEKTRAADAQRRSGEVPETMERFGQYHGFIFYRTRADFPGESAPLHLRKFADAAWIFIDGRPYGKTDLNRNVPVAIPPGELGILVENQGRINTMTARDDRLKGLWEAAVDCRELFYWEIYPLPMTDLSKLKFGPYLEHPQGPCFHRAKFPV